MSITATASQHILTALLARIKNQSVFTAHDVKVDARDMTDENIRHDDVRSIVHNEYLTGEFPDEYNRDEFLELKNGHHAVCYYPDGKTSGDHPMAMYPKAPPIGQAPASITSPVAALNHAVANAAPKAKQGGSVKDGNGFICSETSKGVINIPKDIVDKATKSGDTYDIAINGGTVVYKAPDGKGRLRIASSKLGGGDKFRLEVSAAGVIIIVQA
jgi:hypothetical protein